ncbi:MAG TPA: DUF1937 family protein [Caulifigura sp.]|jgi:nucleoside 2-deoxyribosyltransferase|nr:DUF1937 family protein [Caulifigura sp.]
MIYLAAPYSHPSPTVRRQRYWEACRAAAGLLRAGHAVFSPLQQGHPLVEDHGVPMDWAWWALACMEYLTRSDEIIVLTLNGWSESVGVTAEIGIARTLGKPVRYLAPSPPSLARVTPEARP